MIKVRRFRRKRSSVSVFFIIIATRLKGENWMPRVKRMYINGEWIEAKSNKTFLHKHKHHLAEVRGS